MFSVKTIKRNNIAKTSCNLKSAKDLNRATTASTQSNTIAVSLRQ